MEIEKPDWRTKRTNDFIKWFYGRVKGPTLTDEQVINIKERLER